MCPKTNKSTGENKKKVRLTHIVDGKNPWFLVKMFPKKDPKMPPTWPDEKRHESTAIAAPCVCPKKINN